MKKYENIIFDVGNVLLEYRPERMLQDYGLNENDAKRVCDELFNDSDDLWHIFDLATMTDEEIKNAYCKKHPNDTKAISFFMEHGEYMHIARADVWERVHTLKKCGYNIYLLSNYPESCLKSIRSMPIL